MMKGRGKPKEPKAKELQDKSKHALQNQSARRMSQSMLASRTNLDPKSRLHGVSRGPRRMKDDDFREGDDGNDEWGTAPQLMKPDDQLELSEAELKEEFTRVLTANNPHASTNIIRFSHKEQTFKPIPSIDQLAIHFVLESNLLHKESDEAQRQLNKLEDSDEEDEKEEEDGGENEDEENEGEGGSASGEKKEGGSGKKGKLRNQFNFSERASQTYNNPSRERGTMTEPPPLISFSAVANQMEIYDAYLEEIAKQEKAKEKKGGKSVGDKGKEETKKSSGIELQSDDVSRIGKSSKVMERMVNQNTFDEIAQDFKYYDDPADEFKENEGSLLPLWRFRYEKAKKMGITALSWNRKYWDLFAVGHGSYEFTSQVGGMICFHSLKNPTFPEYIYPINVGVLCLDIHPEHPSLLAVGLYDGTVAVYNLQKKGTEPVFRSTPKTGKHTDPVWQVSWQKNSYDGNLNFMSVASDGRVVTWTIVKNELQYEDTMKLAIPDTAIDGPEGTKNKAFSSCTALCVSPHTDYLYIVGTEEGRIYKCSKAYKDHYLDVFDAHHLAIYSLRWSPFHPKVFASCGADWTVKIWDHTKNEPMFSYDLNSVVGDIAWSPNIATLFAAVTADGKVYIYDLFVNKYKPLSSQSVSLKKKCSLTHVAFNLSHPIILVGDNRGTVLSLKLSPNLRKALKEKNRTNETECAKMEKLINFVNEPLLEQRKDKQ